MTPLLVVGHSVTDSNRNLCEWRFFLGILLGLNLFELCEQSFWEQLFFVVVVIALRMNFPHHSWKCHINL
jgi:hypothetical protein